MSTKKNEQDRYNAAIQAEIDGYDAQRKGQSTSRSFIDFVSDPAIVAMAADMPHVDTEPQE